MYKTTAKYILSVFRHLTIVVVFLGAFTFLIGRPSAFFPHIPSLAAIKVAKGLPAKSAIEKVSLKVSNQKSSLEAILPLSHFAFKLPVVAYKIVAPGYSYVYQQHYQQLSLAPYTARAPGASLISRIFAITIQPNAP